MAQILKLALEKYGPLGAALLLLGWLLYRADQRSDADRAFYYNDLSQQLVETREACRAAKP